MNIRGIVDKMKTFEKGQKLESYIQYSMLLRLFFVPNHTKTGVIYKR